MYMKKIVKKFNTSYISSIRTTLYKIFVTNIPEYEILKELLLQILNEFNNYNLNY